MAGEKMKHLDFYSKEFADSLSAERKVEINEVQRRELIIQYAVEYGIDLQNRVIILTEEIDYPMFDFLDAALTLMESESRKAITIKIKSPGGSIYDALAMVGRMRESTCKIITKGYGAIMSAATLLLAAGNERHMSKYGWFMFHEGAVELGYQKTSNLEDEVRQMKKEETEWCKAMESFTKRTYKYWMNTCKRRDVYLSAEETKEVGAVDKIF